MSDNEESDDGHPPTSPSTGLERAKSVILTPEKKLTMLMIKALIFIDGLTQNDTLMNVYLVAIVGWTPLTASYIWMIRMIIRIAYQPLVGDLVDRVKIHKYTILIIVALFKIASGICMLASTAFGVMVFKSVIDGVVEASFLSAVTAISLGVVGKTRLHKKVAASNNIVKFLGVSLGTVIFGFVSYGIWPDVEKTFWILIAGGLLMLICIFFMLKDVSANSPGVIDHRLSRGRSVFIENVSRMNSVRKLGDAIDVDLEDEDDEKEELVAKRRSMESIQQGQDKGEDYTIEGKGEEEEDEDPAPPSVELGYTEVMTYRQMYGDPRRRRSLICLSLVLFTYHIANSTTVPLLGQYMAINSEDGRSGLPIMTGLILTNSLSKTIVNWTLSDDRASMMGYSNVLLIGSAALCLRLILISIFVNYFKNFWALGATQILDGIGGGCVGLMLMLYSHLLSRRTGHYNLNMAIVNTWKNLGGMVGIFLGGAIVTEKSYEVAFPVLAGLAILPALFTLGVSTPDLKKLD